MVRNVTGPPVTGENLFGREHEVRTLWERLEDGQHVLMLAPRRVGKTSLMQELQRVPNLGWSVFYSDLEGCREAADCVADILAQLAAKPATRTLLESVPFGESISRFLRTLGSIEVEIEGVRVEIKRAIGDEWMDAADKLRERLAQARADLRLLLILDELPILVSALLKVPERRADAERLLGWLRTVRQDPRLRGRVSFLIGGSIGLAGVLRRRNMSSVINDLSAFSVEPWSTSTAIDFLFEVGQSMNFPLSRPMMYAMLTMLGEAVPFHVQLFFQQLRDLCEGDIGRVSEDLIARAFNQRLVGQSGPHLEHYAERLETILSPDELALARAVLDRASKSKRGIRRTALADLPADDSVAMPILRLLEDDGYLLDENGALRFRSHLLREYWRRHQAARLRP